MQRRLGDGVTQRGVAEPEEAAWGCEWMRCEKGGKGVGWLGVSKGRAGEENKRKGICVRKSTPSTATIG